MSKYHISADGVSRICRADKVLCKLGSHYDTQKEAQTAYESLNSENVLKTLKKKNPTVFANSKVVTENDEMLTVYHGSSTDFGAFDPSFTGKGNDSYGSGFYFKRFI